jgi:hypothetical protein
MSSAVTSGRIRVTCGGCRVIDPRTGAASARTRERRRLYGLDRAVLGRARRARWTSDDKRALRPPSAPCVYSPRRPPWQGRRPRGCRRPGGARAASDGRSAAAASAWTRSRRRVRPAECLPHVAARARAAQPDDRRRGWRSPRCSSWRTACGCAAVPPHGDRPAPPPHPCLGDTPYPHLAASAEERREGPAAVE